MAGELQPLDEKFAIVGPDGRPTLYFIKWAQQKQIDIGTSITLQDLEDFLTAHALVAGNGIGLAPDGNLNNSPTITAKVQEILNQISTTRGSVLFRGNTVWQALAPGAAGQFLQTNGAGADPAWAAAGGGGGWTLITATTLGANAASVSFPSIANTYKDLRIEYEARTTVASDNEFFLRFNADAGAAKYRFYDENRFGAVNNTGFSMVRCGASASSSTVANVYAFGVIDIFDYTSARFKNVRGNGFFPSGFEDRDYGTWLDNTVVNQVDLLFNGAMLFAAGSRFRLYGGMT